MLAEQKFLMIFNEICQLQFFNVKLLSSWSYSEVLPKIFLMEMVFCY